LTGTPPYPHLPVTRRDFVNTWECDENAHWNVQFYFRAFEQAARIALSQAGTDDYPEQTGLVRHVRFHSELRSATPVVVRTGQLEGQFPAAILVHFLACSETGRLAATALDHLPGRSADLPLVSVGEASATAPRGVQGGPDIAVDANSLVRSGHAIDRHYSVLASHEAGPGGGMLSSAIVSRLTDAAPHIWEHAGIGQSFLARSGFGRVAVEMKITRLGEARVGAPLRLVSWIADMNEKTFLIRHQLDVMTTGAPVAAASVRCLVMNLESRRAVPVPQAALQSFERRKT
jgi:acyl-CoA thioester hydrolase